MSFYIWYSPFFLSSQSLSSFCELTLSLLSCVSSYCLIHDRACEPGLLLEFVAAELLLFGG